MGDLEVVQHYLVKPNVKVKKLRLEQQIAEKQARVQTLTTQAFSIVQGQLKKIEADKIMAEREVMALTKELDDLERRDDAEIIDV
jgi:cellobiose-specific phosphotransferase system component IIB